MKDSRIKNFYEVFRVAYENGTYAEWFSEQKKLNIPTYYRDTCGDIIEQIEQEDGLFVKVTHYLGFTHAKIERQDEPFVNEIMVVI